MPINSGRGNPFIGMPQLPQGLLHAISLIDDAHSEDPKTIDGPQGPATLPYELHYAQSMSHWLKIRCPTASPVLQVACRAQHFRRWVIPREAYYMNRGGYLTWRTKQKSEAAKQVAEILSSPQIQPPIPRADIDRVAALIRKEQLSTDEETQVLEDCACLVFLDDQFDEFENKGVVDEEKMVGILRKTWGKMSERGRELALGMDLSERAKALIGEALEEST